ncbi:hypothetical protein [Micavibrio aeruginosavorus]|uniref:Uncharacterized protein n=1 Tax=Micavibrio aeruginosavorus (strain ARL-13) TaxID=856793 RepID=G2KNI3_MICAA|nr:hypothetical protein [Micavibrio aeruginosavorus]AEP09831.1 hypothetical protein MICA_1513 [Micavibrio aeruginosavorus ARL-13]
MNNDEQRMSYLHNVLMLDPSFLESVRRLNDMEWDFSGDPVFLERALIRNILDRYLKGILVADDVYQWADFVELREDIQFHAEDDIIPSIVHALANPALEGALTPDSAKTFLLQLE